jgi:L-threonylcarbamoyladenylate synthase
METTILPISHPDAMPHALEILRSGGLVAFPTDTVYGLGALAFSGPAIESIYVAKDRPLEKAIPVLLGVVDDLVRVAYDVPAQAAKLAARFWPGPLTLVLPKHPALPVSVSAAGTVGVRIPDHTAARLLLRLAGPLAVTSANISGQANPSTADEVFAQLGGRIALILDGGPTPGSVASTVVDCVGPEPQILRLGSISQEDIRAALGLP